MSKRNDHCLDPFLVKVFGLFLHCIVLGTQGGRFLTVGDKDICMLQKLFRYGFQGSGLRLPFAPDMTVMVPSPSRSI